MIKFMLGFIAAITFAYMVTPSASEASGRTKIVTVVETGGGAEWQAALEEAQNAALPAGFKQPHGRLQ